MTFIGLLRTCYKLDKFKLNLSHPGSAWTQERRHSWADEGTFGVQQTNQTDDGSGKPVEPLGRFEKVVKREKSTIGRFEKVVKDWN